MSKVKFTFAGLRPGFIPELRHNEFGQLVSNILTVPESDELPAGPLAESFARLLSQEELLKDVRYITKQHVLSPSLTQAAEVRRDHLKSLKETILARRKSPKQDERIAAEKLYTWIKADIRRFSYAGIEIQSRLVNDLQTVRALNSDIDAALDTLVLSETFAHLQSETVSIETMFRRRNEELTKMRSEAKDNRKKIYKELKLFLQALEVAVSLEESNDAVILLYYDRISQFLDYYRTRLKARQNEAKLNAKRPKRAKKTESSTAKTDQASDTASETMGETESENDTGSETEESAIE